MDLIWVIYFIDVLSSSGGASALSIAFLILYVSVIAVYTGGWSSKSCYSEEREVVSKCFPTKTILISCSIMFVYGWLMPSKDTAYKMLAAYGVQEIAQTDSAKRLGGKSLEVLEAAMDSYLKDSKAK